MYALARADARPRQRKVALMLMLPGARHELLLAVSGFRFGFVALNVLAVGLELFRHQLARSGRLTVVLLQRDFQCIGGDFVFCLPDVLGLVERIGIGRQDVVLGGFLGGVGAPEVGDGQDHGEDRDEQGGPEFKGRMIGVFEVFRGVVRFHGEGLGLGLKRALAALDTKAFVAGRRITKPLAHRQKSVRKAPLQSTNNPNYYMGIDFGFPHYWANYIIKKQ